MKKFFSSILLGFFVFLNHAVAYDSYQSFRTHPLSLNLDFQYYTTEANFNANGERESLPSGYSFTHINLKPQLRWQFGSQFAVLGGVNVSSSESKDFAFSRKNSLLNKVDFAAEYLFINQLWLRWFARLSYSHPLETIDYAGDMVLTSTAASEIHPEVILNLDFEDGIYSFLKAGFNIRGNGLSTLATYGLGSEVRFTDFGIGFSLLGQMTIKEDEYTQRASYRDNLNNRVNAASKMFNSINPNIHTLEANFNFLMTAQSLFKIFVGYNILGSNVSTGYYAGANVNWIFGVSPRKSIPSKGSAKPSEPEILFKEKTDDGVNQDYFKPIKPPVRLEERPRRVFLDTTPAQRGKISAEAKKIKIKLRKKTKPKQ